MIHHMKKNPFLPMTFVALAALTFSASGATRFDEFTAKYASPPEPVKVLHAGLLGGAGTEWLASGGFQADGTVVLAGVALGPVLELGVKETVLGKDAALSAPVQAPKLDKKGSPEMNKDGTPKLEPFAWNHENATAFIARMSGDLKTIKSVTRLGWKSGGVTSAVVDAAGNIFIAGPATDGIAGVGGEVQELPAPKEDSKRSGCAQTYIARLTPDAGKVKERVELSKYE